MLRRQQSFAIIRATIPIITHTIEGSELLLSIQRYNYLIDNSKKSPKKYLELFKLPTLQLIVFRQNALEPTRASQPFRMDTMQFVANIHKKSPNKSMMGFLFR